MTTRTNAEIAVDFLDHLAANTITDDLLTDDFVPWTLSHGEMTKDNWFAAVQSLSVVLKAPLRHELVAVTADGERVAVEIISHGDLINGEHYSNNYHFLVVVRDGKVARVKAYFNTKLAADVLGPLFAAKAAEAAR